MNLSLHYYYFGSEIPFLIYIFYILDDSPFYKANNNFLTFFVCEFPFCSFQKIPLVLPLFS